MNVGDGPWRNDLSSALDLAGLDLVVPAAASEEVPGKLLVRYGLECDVPLGDIAIDASSRPILDLVYVVELA